MKQVAQQPRPRICQYKKPDNTLYCRDINATDPIFKGNQIIRHTDPQNPTYQIPTYKEIGLVPSKQIYSFGNQDIAGTLASHPFYNQNLKKVPEMRDQNGDVSQLSRFRLNKTVIHARDPDHNLDVSDISKQIGMIDRQNKVEPVNPHYKHIDAENYVHPQIVVPHDQFYHRPNIHDQQDSALIDGFLQEKQQKNRFLYGYRDNIIDLGCTKDINKQKRQIDYSNFKKQFMENKTLMSVDEIGQEQQSPKIKSTCLNSFCGALEKIAPIFTNNQDFHPDHPSEKTGYLLKQEGRPRSPMNHKIDHEIPLKVAVQSNQLNINYKQLPYNAGIQCLDPRSPIRHKSLELLPGPSPDHYNDHCMHLRHDPEINFQKQQFDWTTAVAKKPKFEQPIQIGQVPQNPKKKPLDNQEYQRLRSDSPSRTYSGVRQNSTRAENPGFLIDQIEVKEKDDTIYRGNPKQLQYSRSSSPTRRPEKQIIELERHLYELQMVAELP